LERNVEQVTGSWLLSSQAGYNIIFLISGNSVSIHHVGIATVPHINDIITRTGVARQHAPGRIHQGIRLKTKLILKTDLVFIVADLLYW
jgi:hypothetical protein